MSELRISGLEKSFGAFHVLKNISLHVNTGEFIAFVGPSGCGKSTLLRCISGLESISGGTMTIDGRPIENIDPAKRGMAMVFQNYALYPHMTVFDNIAFSLKMQGLDKEAIRAKVETTARKLHLTELLGRLPSQLSGGQRQRVAIGRAFVRDPKVFLFDEPLSNLDADLRVHMRLEMAQLKVQMPHASIIYVTHDQVEAMTLADRIVVLNGGRIEQIGTPMELYEKPQSLFVAGFIGSPKMNFLTGEHAAVFNTHTLGLRPEAVEIVPENGVWAGRVIHSENLGADNHIWVDIGSQAPVIARQPGKAKYAIGDQVALSPNEAGLYRFDAQGKLQSAGRQSINA
ncbi:UNVERIFIED_ORG: ABC transporter ATP-binding protein (plasmid) [Roseateles sp. XES5]|nr:ABC transporter ATP-binding protein [Roseateles sp. XES5]